MWKEFWESFKLNFKHSTTVWCGLLVFYLVAIFCVYTAYLNSESIGVFSVILIFLLLTSIVNTWAIYVFAYMARFEMQISKIVKNCALIELANFAWSVLISLVFIISFIICFFVPVAFAVVPAYYVLICDLILARVFRKYMSKEDLEQELLWMETEDL